MRHLSAGLAVLTLLAGSTYASAMALPGQSAPAEQAAQAAKPDTERTVSLVIRVRPEQIKKVAGDLAQMVQGGESLGLPWLKQAFGSITAEVVIEDEAASGEASTAFRASSDGWVGRSRSESQPPQQAGGFAGGGTGTAGGVSAETRYATAMAIIGQHAAAIRDGAVALMDKLPEDKAAELRRQIQQLTAATGEIGKTLEGVLPVQPPGSTPPK